MAEKTSYFSAASARSANTRKLIFFRLGCRSGYMKVNNRSRTSERSGMGTTSSFLDSNSAAGKAAEQHSRFFLWMRNKIPSTDWKVMSASDALTAPTR